MKFKDVLQYVFWAVGLGLNLMVIAAMLRNDYRKYKFVFVYAVALLLATTVEIAAFTAPNLIAEGVADKYYWADEIILDVLGFCIVIGFIDQAAENAKRRPIKRSWLIAGTGVILVASFLLHPSNFNRRMTLVSRDLNICAVVLDLMLWSLLTATRQPNRRLMLLSGGFGLQLTGAIIGESLRHLSRSLLFFGSLVEITTGLLGLLVWWAAFRGQESRARVIPMPPRHPASPQGQRTRLD